MAMPSLLEWYSYVFATGNLLAGPFFELRDYRLESQSCSMLSLRQFSKERL